MCVKTKRIDVAEVCLGNMRFARGAKAVREAKSETEVEAHLAMVALQLNMLDDAKKLYEECGRNDLLNEMLQAAGDWEEAVNIAEKNDRINLKQTHYKMARHYETLGDFARAIEHYEASDSFRTEVPRMLFACGRTNELEKYIMGKDDKALFKWWANFLESKSDFSNAHMAYEKAGDFASQVRLHCLQGDFQAAEEVCTRT